MSNKNRPQQTISHTPRLFFPGVSYAFLWRRQAGAWASGKVAKNMPYAVLIAQVGSLTIAVSNAEPCRSTHSLWPAEALHTLSL